MGQVIESAPRGEDMGFRIVVAFVPLLVGLPALALDGQVGIHDPSTIVQCDGKFYTWGTGGRGLVSSDGWTWERGAAHGGGGGLATCGMRLRGRYYTSRSLPR